LPESRTIIVIAREHCRQRGESLAGGIASSDWGDAGPAHVAIRFEPWPATYEIAEQFTADALIVLPDGKTDRELLQLLEHASMRSIPVVLVDRARDGAAPKGCMRLPIDASDGCIAAATLAYLVCSDELHRVERELRLIERVADGVQAEITRVDEELQMASLVQQEFLPRVPNAVEGVEFATLWRPASSVSGDIYDIVRLDERRVGIFLADAVGHGVPAALMSMLLCRSLETKERYSERHATVDRILPPAEALARLNIAMAARQGRMGRYAAAMYAIVDCRERTMRIASAGGPPPLILSRSVGLRVLPVTGPLLGMNVQQEFDEQVIQLAPDDRVLFHSDGFEQAFRDGGELMAQPEILPRYLEEFAKLRDVAHADDAIKAISRKLDSEAGSLHPCDDCTMVLVHARGAAAHGAMAPHAAHAAA